MKEADLPETVPTEKEKKAGEGQVAAAKAAPSYAPVPPGESNYAYSQNKQEEVYRAQQKSVGGISGPRQQQKADSSLDKLQDRERDAPKDVARVDDGRKGAETQSIASNQPMNTRRAVDEKSKGGPMRNIENNNNNLINRGANEARAEPPKTLSGADKRSTPEEAPATRSAGGRKFRRQGNAWVDQKFKSSMSLKNISRGSDEFGTLDSALRSIAQQLGGEIIVVWKGKAYLIK
jgi:hypothetical protein